MSDKVTSGTERCGRNARVWRLTRSAPTVTVNACPYARQSRRIPIMTIYLPQLNLAAQAEPASKVHRVHGARPRRTSMIATAVSWFIQSMVSINAVHGLDGKDMPLADA